ncbi:MAG: hypothetical protein ACTSWZ_03205 [Candidatus Heimdallarchaeaceae archaeon]
MISKINSVTPVRTRKATTKNENEVIMNSIIKYYIKREKSKKDLGKEKKQ